MYDAVSEALEDIERQTIESLRNEWEGWENS